MVQPTSLQNLCETKEKKHKKNVVIFHFHFWNFTRLFFLFSFFLWLIFLCRFFLVVAVVVVYLTILIWRTFQQKNTQWKFSSTFFDDINTRSLSSCFKFLLSFLYTHDSFASSENQTKKKKAQLNKFVSHSNPKRRKNNAFFPLPPSAKFLISVSF